jgi:uncharacterized protein YbaP (TraB family)
MRWRTDPIVRALYRSDVFVFEAPQDAAAVAQNKALIQAQGLLPPGPNLRSRLSPSALPPYDAAVAASGLASTTLEGERPWLADQQLNAVKLARLRYRAGDGVDSAIMVQAIKYRKPARYLETIADQFALLVPDDPDMERQAFEADLKGLNNFSTGAGPIVDAWSRGDQTRLAQLIDADFKEAPLARKLLLDDRNKKWAPRIEAMLKAKYVFFITVGAGHLTGPAGVPANPCNAGAIHTRRRGWSGRSWCAGALIVGPQAS